MDIITLIVAAGAVAAIMVLTAMWRYERDAANDTADENFLLREQCTRNAHTIERLERQIEVLTEHRDYEVIDHLKNGAF